MGTKCSKTSLLCTLTLLALIVATAGFDSYSAADVYIYTGEVPPDKQTYPPVISITSPINNTAYNTSRIPLTFTVAAPQSSTASFTTVHDVTYEVDWKTGSIDLFGGKAPSFTLWLSNVPEGQHSITIKAVGYGLYQDEWYSYKWFFIRSAATISFTIDQSAPTVSILPIANLSTASEVPLNILFDEDCPKIAYSINGQQNITVSGNSTLPPLSAGQYNVTFYIWDAAGNAGASETSNFTITEAPQTIEATDDFLIVSMAAVLLVGVIIFSIIYLSNRRLSRSRNSQY